MNPDKMYTYSRLGRAVDPRYRTNLIIMILTPLAAVVAFIAAIVLGHTNFTNALIAAFWIAVSTFFTWALARELDPDHDWSAFVGVALVWIAMFVYRVPAIAIISIGALSGFLRVTNRTIGLPLLPVDSALILLAIIIVAFTGNWIVAVIGVASLVLDGLLVNPVRRHLIYAAIGAIMIVLRLVILDFPTTQGLSGLHVIVVIGISVAFFMTIAATRKVTCEADIKGATIDVRRVRAGMMLALAAGLVSVLWNGDAGFVWMLPLWAAMLGTALYRLPVTVQEWRVYQQQKANAA